VWHTYERAGRVYASIGNRNRERFVERIQRTQPSYLLRKVPCGLCLLAPAALRRAWQCFEGRLRAR